MNLETTNYDLFKSALGNREVYNPLVKSIAKDMKDRGFSPDFPVLVKPASGHFVVIDGQHRLAAAKLANIPVKYKITQESEADIPRINSLKRAWSTIDFVRYWSAYGRQPYSKLIELSAQYNVDCSALACVLASNDQRSGTNLSSVKQEIKSGKFTFNEDQLANLHRVMEMVNDIRFYSPLYKEFGSSTPFIRAILRLVCAGGYDHSRMLNNLGRKQSNIVKCTSILSYLVLLEGVYNYRTKAEHRRVSLL